MKRPSRLAVLAGLSILVTPLAASAGGQPMTQPGDDRDAFSPVHRDGQYGPSGTGTSFSG
jgi:hypothetical protein